MSPRERYRSLLDDCLDQRRDPLDQPELVALLDANPELLEDFARDREDLRLLAGPRTRSGRAPRWRRAAAIGAAAGVAATFAAWALLTTSDPEPAERPPRILSADLVEVAPRLNAATTMTLHEPLLRTDRVVLETYERRSLTR